MLQLDATWLDNISNRIWPVPLLVVKAAGNRVYSNRDVSDITASVFGPTEEPVISFENRVKSFGTIERTFIDSTQTIVNSFQQKRLQVATIVLNNSDYELSTLINQERWHNRALQIFLAYANSTVKLKIFEGVIQDISYSLSRGTVNIKATETGYDKVFKPVRVADLETALVMTVRGPNAEVPVVYGEIDNTALTTLPSIGAWEAPFLGISNAPAGLWYGYAAHEVLGTALNSPRVWYDSAESTDFVFTPDSTIFQDVNGNNLALIFTTVPVAFKSKVTIRGKGKPSSAASTVLMENLVDIIDDFITVENSSVFTFDPTNKADASAFLDSTVFTPTVPSRFSGVITQTIPVWTQIQEMLSGLGGSAFISSDDGELKVITDEFIKIPDNSLIISRGDIINTQTVSRIKNVYNSINSRHAWFPAEGEFSSTNVTVTNSSSINIYGTRELTLDTKWSFNGEDATFLKSELRFTVSRPLDIITCIIANPVIVQIEPGLDYLYLTFENLIGADGEVRINEFCKVLSIKFLLDKNKAELTVMDTNRWKVTGTGQWIGDSSPRDMTLY